MWDDPDSKAYEQRVKMLDTIEGYKEEAMERIASVVMEPAAEALAKVIVDAWGCDIDGCEELREICEIEVIHIAALKGEIEWFEELYKREMEPM